MDEFIENPWANTIRYTLLALTDSISNGKHFQYQEYEQDDECCAALAAAEVVAASIGRPSADFPEELWPILDSLVIGKDTRMRKLARLAVKNVLQHSELRNLWAETGDDVLQEWEAVQQDLLIRLK